MKALLGQDKDVLTLCLGRVFACCSAANIPNPTDATLKQLLNLLNQPMYLPSKINWKEDCKAYISAVREPHSVQVVFIPSWARAGVRYARQGIDIRQLDPADWHHCWWDLYRATMPDMNDASEQAEQFGQMFESLGENTDVTRALIDRDCLVIKADVIRNLTGSSLMQRT